MRSATHICSAIILAFFMVSCDNATPVSTEVVDLEDFVLNKAQEHAVTEVFQAAGAPGARGVLAEGATFPPTKGGKSILHRGKDWISYNIHTTGLPPGAYTNWWVIINNPRACFTELCGFDDVFANPDADASVFWADGGVVQANGVGNFSARISEGEPSGGPDGFIIGNGLTDAQGAEVHLIIKYHGPVSDDPDEFFEQTYTLLGLCDDRANALPNGQCFDPQFAIHRR